ncbi:MAG: GTP pyrophosphokinase family protein [Erysipelotrichaceae bacterium]|nr:GTP pyrophosphokinase family protein [Erysipelotrichaceae bacterium]
MSSQISNPFFDVETFETVPADGSTQSVEEFNRWYIQMMEAHEEALEQVLGYLLDAKRVLEKANGSTMVRSISTRLKSTRSICEKLERLGQPVSLVSMHEHLFDLAGIRVVCSYIDDIYVLKNWLAYNTPLRMVNVKDYIQNPKESGYRSLHIILQVRHEPSGQYLNVELQLRTMAMDSWAALEHQMRYKKGKVVSEEISQELYDCARTLYESDLKMQKIHRLLSVPALSEESKPSEP